MYFKPFNRHVLCRILFTNIKIRLISTSCIRLYCWSQILRSASGPRACNQLHLCWTSCTFVILLKSAGLFTSTRQVCMELIPWADPSFLLASLWIRTGREKSALGRTIKFSSSESYWRQNFGTRLAGSHWRRKGSCRRHAWSAVEGIFWGIKEIMENKRAAERFPSWAEPFEVLWKITSTSWNGRNGKKQ